MTFIILSLTVILLASLPSLVELVVWIKSERHYRQELSKPCSHGVAGAASDSSKCSVCGYEEAARTKREQRKRALEKQRAEEQRLRKYREWLETIRVPGYLREMDPRGFEKPVRRLFKRMGYEVEPTRHVGDGGSDGYLFKDGRKAVLQCKRVQGSVGEPVLRDLYGTMHASGSCEAFVVTTGRVSTQARTWIDDKLIRIIELDELMGLLRQYFPSTDLVPADFVPASCAGAPCRRCGKPLREIKGRSGPFMGCSGYPKCRFTADVPESLADLANG